MATTEHYAAPAYQCGGKIQYVRKGDAKRALRRTQTTRPDPQGTRPLNIYRCPHCGFFHVGHAPKGR